MVLADKAVPEGCSKELMSRLYFMIINFVYIYKPQINYFVLW